MVDFGFYTHTYLGSNIPEKQFAACAARAAEALDHFRRVYQVEGGPQAQDMAICAMAEAVHAASCRSGVVSASAGSVSVRYGDKQTRLQRELYEKARIYLDIYRGVS